MHLQLAWRNIWRNPWRTLVILTAVVIGTWAMLIFGGLSRGMIESMLSNSLNTLVGHVQIQNPGYRDDPVMENRISNPDLTVPLIQKHLPPDAIWTQRVMVEGVASNARHSQGVSVVGVDPDREPAISFYGDNIMAGRLLTHSDSHGIVIGKALADAFETRIGRKLVLMTRSADGETASRAFKIRGIYRAELEATEKRHLFITLSAARKLIRADDAVTSFCIVLPEPEMAGQTAAALKVHLPEDTAALTWEELLPLIKGYLGMFDTFMLLWYLVVFVAMGFGLVNTMLMAVLERTREFGLLKALGMKPIWIVRGVITESLILLALGLAAGNLLGMATVRALSGGIDLSFLSQGSEYVGMGHIIIPFLTIKDILTANAVILLLGLLVCLYPAIKAGRITPVEAMTQT